MEHNLEDSRTTSPDKKVPTTKLRHMGSQKLREKSAFWISFERKHMICHYFVINQACTMQILTRNSTKIIAAEQKQQIKETIHI